MVIPIDMNGSVKRLQEHKDKGWKIKQIGITSKNELLFYVKKNKTKKENYKNHLGLILMQIMFLLQY